MLDHLPGYFLIGASILVLIFAFLLIAVRRRSASRLADTYTLLEARTKDMTESKDFARRVQDAILPKKEFLTRLFPEVFVLFQPKNTVSGDFYWFAEKDGKKLVAAIDCTGDGVKGAFMSMLGNAFLDEIVNEKGITRPDLVLSELRHLVIRSLKQSAAASDEEHREGMDISLVCIDTNTNTVEFAGANHPLWLVKGGKVEEIEPDKRHIGYFKGLGLPFNCQKLNVHKGDTLYIFSDGYADQYGGPEGKKFMYRQMKELIIGMQNMTMEGQGEMMRRKMEEWKGHLDQVDDILVVGIKL